MPDLSHARAAGASAVRSMGELLGERAAMLLQRDPDLVSTAVEVGLVDRDWVDDPRGNPVRSATPLQVVQRFVERSVERRPSVLGAVGLNALQLLAARAEEPNDGAPTPIAIVFTDIEGFTRFTADHGDEAALSLLAEHHRTVGPVVRSRGGQVVKRIGDGLMLSFPSAEAAVLAAVELVEAPPAPLQLRAGVHCGDAVVLPGDLIGHDVNVAARVAESATGGQVIATTAVREAAGEIRSLAFGRARRRRFKGLAESVAVCRVTRTREYR